MPVIVEVPPENPNDGTTLLAALSTSAHHGARPHGAG
jgi:hypothetical protein